MNAVSYVPVYVPVVRVTHGGPPAPEWLLWSFGGFMVLLVLAVCLDLYKDQELARHTASAKPRGVSLRICFVFLDLPPSL